ncbi:MAG: gamma-glutamylcyclotransferase family protein [Pseudomonadales bacterium]
MLNGYFAYGSNMNPQRMQQRGLLVLSANGARLPEHALVFDKIGPERIGAGHANIVRMPGAEVQGVFYELGHIEEIFKMDPFERAPINYGRDAVQVWVQGRAQWAWTYFANPARRRTGLKPTADYLGHLLAGSHFLSTDYCKALRATSCLIE